jgi:tetratricopeptide (TPR) repeat protein
MNHLEHTIDLAFEKMSLNALGDSEALFREALLNLSSLPDSPAKTNLLIRAHSGLSFCLCRQSRFLESEEVGAKALALLSNETPYALAANAYYFFGLAKYYLCKFDEALPLIQQSYTISEQHKDAKLTGRAANTIANIFFNFGDYKTATEYYQISLAQMRQVQNDSGIAMALNNIGVVFRTIGDLTSALEVHEESLSIRRRINEVSGIAMSLNNIANIHLDLHDYPTALAVVKESLALHETLSDTYGTALSLNIVGSCYQGLNDIQSAFEAHWQSLLLRLKIKDRVGEVLTYLSLGELYAKYPSLPKRFPHEPSTD